MNVTNKRLNLKQICDYHMEQNMSMAEWNKSVVRAH